MKVALAMESILNDSTHTPEEIWSDLGWTLDRLGLKGRDWKYGVDHINHTNTYLITYCQNHPWCDVNLAEADEADVDQLEALAFLDRAEIELKLHAIFLKMFSE